MLSLLALALLSTPDLDIASRTQIASALHVRSFDLQIPAIVETRDWLRVELELDGRPTVLLLQPHSVRSERFGVWSTHTDGSLHASAAPPVGTWRGCVEHEPQRLAALGRTADGVLASVREPDGRTHFIQPLARLAPGSAPGLHVVHSSDDLALPPGFCGSDGLRVQPDSRSVLGGSNDGGPGCFRIAELAFDVDFEYFTASGSSVPQTVANIEAVMAAVNLVYAHEVQIEHVLTHVIVRSSEPDPYSSFEPGELLDALRNTWNGPLSGLQRDHVHLATGREMNGNIIGLAYVGVLCNASFGYGLTQFNLGFGGHVSVVAHELGHNWNAPHCLDNICGIMCGGCVLEFGPLTTDTILAHRNAVSCLDVSDGFANPVAPEAERDFAEGTVQILIDVLANDLDGNCDTVLIDSFDRLSSQGAAVHRSLATGPGGRDELRYVPAAGFQGVDDFAYVAGDGSGLSESAPVRVRTYDEFPDLTGHWKLDEPAGPDLVDASANAMQGEFLGSPVYQQAGAAPGTGSSVRFGGFGARGRVLQAPQLSGLSSAFSVTAWVRPESLMGAARIFGNGQSWRFTLQDGRPTLQFDGGAEYQHTSALAANTWSHVAATFLAGEQVRLYIDGTLVLSAPAAGASAASASEWYLGGGSNVTTALFPGRIDDVQVYDHTLGDEGVAALFADPGSVWIPCKPASRFCESAPNSTGLPAVLAAIGAPSLSGASVLLLASTVPTGQFGLLFFGPEALLQPFGNGTLCVGGGVTRLAPVQADLLGVAQMTLDLDTPAFGVEVGDRLLLQFWYRDPAGAGPGFNLSDALSIEICP